MPRTMFPGKPMPVDPHLTRWATPRQAEYIEAINRLGSHRRAAEESGVHPNAIHQAVKAVKKKAKEACVAAFAEAERDVQQAADALDLPAHVFVRWMQTGLEGARQEAIYPKVTDGFVVREVTKAYDDGGEVTGEWVREGPMPASAHGGVDAGPARDGFDEYVIGGVSTLYDGAGNMRAQWVKTRKEDREQLARLQIIAGALAADLPRLSPADVPESVATHLCNLFTLTDVHIGMLAWHKEGGADWDLSIAERVLVACLERMIISCPAAGTAILNIQGDTLHYDGLLPVTPTHGYVLDADSRFQKMVATAIRIIRRLVDMALMTHSRVHVILAEGNHDPASAVWLRMMFAALYENEPRLTVNDSELPYYVYQHGKTMIAVHHGHMKKNDNLPLMFAAAYPAIWGSTAYRYCHTGHRHHVEDKEHDGMRVIQHPTLAARDAHTARHGWMSLRQARAITYHDQFGEVGSTTVVPEMLEAA